MQAIKINAEHTESVRKDLLKGKCWQQSESACYFSDIMLSKFSFFSVNVYLLLFSVHEMRDGSMTVCLHSVGSDLTCTWELPELQQNVSMQSGQEAAAVDKDPRTPTSVREVYPQPGLPVAARIIRAYAGGVVVTVDEE